MDPKRFVIATLIGTVVMYALGYLIFDTAMASFYAANRSHDMSREAPLLWATVLGSLSLAALLTLAVAHASDDLTFPAGAKAGATVGFLVWLGVDFIRFAGVDFWTLTLTIVDPLLEIIRGGITGAVIALVLVRTGQRTAASTPTT